MGSTFQSLLDSFIQALDAEYRNDPDRYAARLDNIESTVQQMLEMLRDRLGG